MSEKQLAAGRKKGKKGLSIREMAVFAMLGALMFASRIIMAVLPNIHIIGLLIIVCTLTYRSRALIPIYLYVFLEGVLAGFSPWWVPYLYIWTLLWGATMLLPKKMPVWLCSVMYPLLGSLHGLLFGVLYAPAQALLYGLTFEETLAWIAAGLTFDILHMIGNFCAGLFILPLYRVMQRLEKRRN